MLCGSVYQTTCSGADIVGLGTHRERSVLSLSGFRCPSGPQTILSVRAVMNSEPDSETCRAHLHSDRRTIECPETIGGPAHPACFGRAVVHDSSIRCSRGCGDSDRTILRRLWRGHRLGAEPQEARRGAETATCPSIP